MNTYIITMIILGITGIIMLAIQIAICIISKRRELKLSSISIIIFMILIVVTFYFSVFRIGNFGANPILDGHHKTLIILGIICILMFFMQLMFCVTKKSKIIKRIPLYIILFFTLFAIILYIGVLGSGSFGGTRIVAVLIIMGIVPAFIGNALAWLGYGIIKKNKRKN